MEASRRSLCALLLAVPFALAAGRGSHKTALDSVFRIQTVSQPPDRLAPWRRGDVENATGSGFYIGEGRILTNAHVVKHARYVSLHRHGDSRSAEAVVEHIAHDVDLALLRVADKAYFDGVRPLAFGGLPALQSPVTVVGFPIGGEKVSITKGVVSRLESRVYVHSGYHRHLMIQVDSAINAGNSGGPVMQEDKVAGVAFQTMTSAQSVGYVIPSMVVERFLRDVEDGRYDGHPELGVRVQKKALLNAGARAYYGLREGQSGVLVSNVAPYGSAHGLLRVEDVLSSVAGYPIDPYGRIRFGSETIQFDVIFDLAAVGEVVTFEVIRDGKPLKVDVKAAPRSQTFFPGRTHADAPPYVVYGGFVFTSVDRDSLRHDMWRNLRDRHLVLRFFHAMADTDPFVREVDEIVLVAQRLAHGGNDRMLGREGAVVTSVNGRPVRGLRDLHVLLGESKEDFVTIGLWSDVEPMTFHRETAERATAEVLATYGVPSDHRFMVKASVGNVATKNGGGHEKR